MCVSKATVILHLQEEMEEKEMSRDVSGIDRTGACPPSFINKDNLPNVCGRSVSMTMSKAGTHPSNTCEKHSNNGLITKTENKTAENKAKNQRFTLSRYILSIDGILRRPFGTFRFGILFFSAVTMFYKKLKYSHDVQY